ncbi:MAG: GLUG motif-containing protein, partial [Bacteroidales bacterium]
MRNFYTVICTLILMAMCSNVLSQTSTAPASGDGSEGNPYEIADLNNLYWLSQNSSEWDKHYIQTADIDASATSGWDSNQGWTPVGNGTISFTGGYDGQSHIIEDLFINRPGENYQGFFGRTNGSSSNSTTIKNLGIVNASITANSRVGALIGATDQYCLIENCFSTGAVNASGQYSGGLIGENYANNEVSNCYSRCSVNSSSNGAGGLIGLSGNGCTVNNCYSTGAVSGSSGVGGLIGINTSIVNSSFWDTQTSGQAASAAGTGKTTAEMKSVATFTDLATAGLSSAWDFRGYPNDDTGFDDLWDIETLLNDGYPFLNWQFASQPSVRMTDIESIGPSTAIINAEVTNDGGAEITQRGVCWNT